jgi:NADPH:quinone reductase-like Zn-dependent oxidoreductase
MRPNGLISIQRLMGNEAKNISLIVGPSIRSTEKKVSKKLKDKIALITGGTEGIGLATAKLFAKEGAYVFITGRRQKERDEGVKAIGSNVYGVQGDVAKLDDLDRLYKTVST